MTIGQKLAKVARRALEDLAAEEFSRARVLNACQTAAAKGYLSCEIRPSVPVDISGTQHVKELSTFLQEQWIESNWMPQGLPGEPRYKVLQLRWEGRR